jgi:hypothetical protein
MRIAHVTVALLLAALTAPGAWACWPVSPQSPPPPQVFWLEAPKPSQLKPGEVVLRVSFDRFSIPEDPDLQQFAVGDIVILSCNTPRNKVFTILEIVGGDDPGRGPLLVGGGYGYDAGGMDLILVGRIVPLRPENAAAYELADGEAWRLLQPRLPVGAEAAPTIRTAETWVGPTFPVQETRLNVP